MGRTMTFYDLRDAMALPGCPICRLNVRAAESFIDGLLWEMVNDPDARQDIRQAQGFCHNHAWEMVRQGASLGASIIVHDVLKHVIQATEKSVRPRGPTSLAERVRGQLWSRRAKAAGKASMLSQLEPQGKCPVCEQTATMETVCVGEVVENLVGQDGLLGTYRSSEGLCLRHFRLVASRVDDPEAFEMLVGAQRAIWQRLTDQLDEVIRKFDYRFKDETRGEETGACVRGIAALVGPRSDSIQSGERQDHRSKPPFAIKARKKLD
jgi:hypothetical protein